MSTAQLDIWVPRIALILDAIAAALVVRKRLWRQLLAFSWYLLFGLFASLLFLVVKHWFRYLYFYCYFFVDITYKIFNVWVTFEIYSRLMNSFPALRQVAWKVLWISGVILLATCALVYKVSNFAGVDPLFKVLITVGRSFRVVQLGLLTVIFLIARSFRLQLRRYYLFIALGLIVIDSFEFVGLSTFLSSHRSVFYLVDHVRMVTSVAVTALWIVVLYIGEGPGASGAPPDYAALPLPDIEEWNAALGEIRQQ